MPTPRFVRYDLRTLDVDAAKSFYGALLGERLWGPDVAVWRLHEQAIARRARPHWLGHVGPCDVDDVVRRMKDAGGEALGPTVTDGARRFAVVRDPFGAVLAVSSEAGGEGRDVVGSHVLHTKDHERAFALYASLFGWSATARVDLPSVGKSQGFAWEPGGATVGFVTDGVLAKDVHVHPQWLFFFVVEDLDAAVDRVRAHRGLALPTSRSPAGDLVTPCDDGQGAAFALLQPVSLAGAPSDVSGSA